MKKLSDSIKDAIKEPHDILEEMEFSKMLFCGQLSLEKYASYLNGLRGIYQVLETGIRENAQHPAIGLLNYPSLWRLNRIDRDLDNLPEPANSQWQAINAARLRQIIGERPVRLIAAAYVRYMGDLGGGAILARQLHKTWESNGNPPLSLSFYEFEESPQSLRQRIRDAIDHPILTASDQADITKTILTFFQEHIKWFSKLV